MKKIVRTIVVPGRDILEEDSGSGLATARPSVYKRGGGCPGTAALYQDLLLDQRRGDWESYQKVILFM